jgi:two-component system, NarL family, sensor kinase
MPENFRDIQEGITNSVRVGAVIFLILAGLFIFFIGTSVQRRRKMLHKQQLMKTQFQQELLQTQLEIQEQTLKTISEEIHDNVGQVLSLAKLNLNTFDSHPEQKLQDTKQLISKAINDLRNLSRSLHGDRIAELGLQQSIADELQIVENSGAFKTELVVTGSAYKLPPQKEMVLFRIVQEALNNSIKHARAKCITLQLQYRPDAFSLSITDDGNGFDTALLPGKAGIGLKSMQNRAQLIGGSFNLQTTPGSGTSITIELPNP